MEWALRLRNRLYDWNFLDRVRAPFPVVSIGNLTMGGTGKTPMLEFLARHLQSRGRRLAIVSRNYRAQCDVFSKVDLSHPTGAVFFGDEPWMLANALHGVDVYVTSRKFEASTLRNYDLLFVDDGFQHRALGRNLDLVLIDASRPVESLRTFPRGDAREPLSGLRRADAVILTKVNQASADAAARYEDFVKPHFGGPIYQAAYAMELPELLGKSVLAVSGIARPENFENPLRERAARLEVLRYRDHHIYTDEDIREIERIGRTVDLVLTTEKDIAKIQNRVTLANLGTIPVRVSWLTDWTSLAERIDALFC